LNVGEGSRRLGRDRVHHYAVAAGSARVDGIDTAEAWGYVDPEVTVGARRLLDRELALLWKWTHTGSGR
jgi:hypothetical protein